jgi:hypothetical protein
MGGSCSTRTKSVGKPEGGDCPEDLDVDGKTVLEWILGK